MWPSGAEDKRIYENLTVQLKLSICIVFEVLVLNNPLWLLPLSLELLWSDPCVCFDTGHFADATNTLWVATGTEVDDYHLESVVRDACFSCWCDHSLKERKCEERLSHNMNPQVWTDGNVLNLSPSLCKQKWTPGGPMSLFRTKFDVNQK